jgi:hypothetical protein
LASRFYQGCEIVRYGGEVGEAIETREIGERTIEKKSAGEEIEVFGGDAKKLELSEIGSGAAAAFGDIDH